MTSREISEVVEGWPERAQLPLVLRQQLAWDVIASAGESFRTAENKLAVAYPLCAFVEAFSEIGLIPSGSYWRRLKHVLLLGFARAFLKGAQDRPGVNDFLMCKWFITRDPRLVEAIAARLRHPDPAIAMSCSWMLNSVCQRHPDLLQQYQELVDRGHAPTYFVGGLGDRNA